MGAYLCQLLSQKSARDGEAVIQFRLEQKNSGEKEEREMVRKGM